MLAIAMPYKMFGTGIRYRLGLQILLKRNLRKINCIGKHRKLQKLGLLLDKLQGKFSCLVFEIH